MPDTIPCRSCKEPIKTEAEKCPHCGERVIGLGHVVLAAILGLPGGALAAFVGFALAGAIDPSLTYSLGGNGFLALMAFSWALIVVIFAIPFAKRRARLKDSTHHTQKAESTTPPLRERYPRTSRTGRYLLYALGVVVILGLLTGALNEASLDVVFTVTEKLYFVSVAGFWLLFGVMILALIADIVGGERLPDWLEQGVLRRSNK